MMGIESEWIGATDASGFSAIPNRYVYLSGKQAHFWSSTSYDDDSPYAWVGKDYVGFNSDYKSSFKSIRCIQDDP